MVIAQEWINNNYPLNQRANVRRLLVCNASQREDHESENLIASYGEIENKHYLSDNNSLTGTLDLSTFTNLKRVVIEKQFINRLILTDCLQLKEVQVGNNLLREIELPSNSWSLKILDLTNNNFPAQKFILLFSFY